MLGSKSLLQVSVESLSTPRESFSLTNRLVTRPTMSQIFKRFMSYVGKVKLEDVPKDWQNAVVDALTAVEAAVRFMLSFMPSLQKMSSNRHL